MPFVISGISSALMIVFGVEFLNLSAHPATGDFLETFLRVEDLLGTQILALALAYSLASFIGTIALAIYFQMRFGTFFKEIGQSLGESFMAAFAAATASYFTLHSIGDITLSSTLLSVLLKGSAAGFAGCAAAALAYFLLGNREYGENALALRRRIWKDVEPVTSAEQTA